MGQYGRSRRRKYRVQFCEICGRKYKTERGYISHLLTHELDVYPFICKEEGCDKKYKKEVNFLAHQKRHKEEEVEKAMKALEVRRKRRRRGILLRYPCMFCTFWTNSRSHAEKHMAVRHNTRYRKSRHLIRAHADALEIQHHQMLLALEIEESLNGNLSWHGKDEPCTPRNPTIVEEEEIEILCATCGRVFHFSGDYERHLCETPSFTLEKGGMGYQFVTNVGQTSAYTLEKGATGYQWVSNAPQYGNYFIINNENEYSNGLSMAQPPAGPNSAPMDPSLHSDDIQVIGVVQKVDPLENLNVMTLLSTNVSVAQSTTTTTTTTTEQPVVFTFQDLLVLEQNLNPFSPSSFFGHTG